MAVKKQDKSPTMNVLVTVDESHRDRLDSMAGSLASAGLNVADTFALGGIIAGNVATSDLAKLHRVEGVKAIEEEPSFTAGR